MRLRLEPWGEEYELPSGATVQVLARGPEGDTLEVQWEEDAVTVYGWPGSVVALLRRGVDVGAPAGAKESARQTAPFLPEGMRVREWLDEMAF